MAAFTFLAGKKRPRGSKDLEARGRHMTRTLSFYTIFCIFLLMSCNGSLIFCFSCLDFDSEKIACLGEVCTFPTCGLNLFLLPSKSRSFFIAPFSLPNISKHHVFACRAICRSSEKSLALTWPNSQRPGGRFLDTDVTVVSVGPLLIRWMSQMSLVFLLNLMVHWSTAHVYRCIIYIYICIRTVYTYNSYIHINMTSCEFLGCIKMADL